MPHRQKEPAKDKREPSLGTLGEGHGTREALGNAARKNSPVNGVGEISPISEIFFSNSKRGYNKKYSHKSRRKGGLVVQGNPRPICLGQCRETIKYKVVDILESHMMPDHVHMLVAIPPKISLWDI